MKDITTEQLETLRLKLADMDVHSIEQYLASMPARLPGIGTLIYVIIDEAAEKYKALLPENTDMTHVRNLLVTILLKLVFVLESMDTYANPPLFIDKSHVKTAMSLIKSMGQYHEAGGDVGAIPDAPDPSGVTIVDQSARFLVTALKRNPGLMLIAQEYITFVKHSNYPMEQMELMVNTCLQITTLLAISLEVACGVDPVPGMMSLTTNDLLATKDELFNKVNKDVKQDDKPKTRGNYTDKDARPKFV